METVKGVSLKHQIEDGGNIRVKISGRLSFAHLFKPDDFNGSSKPKYKATFIIEDDAMTADIKTLINHVASSCAELKGKKLGADKGNSTYLYELFPYGPAKQACKIGGLPKPTGCV